MPDARRDRAVSSLVGNSVLIAIAAILAAAVATFAIGFAFQLLILDGGASGGTTDVPDATFSITYYDDASVVVLTHTGGDAIPSDRLLVRHDREPVSVEWPGEPVRAGDSVRVQPVAPGDQIAVAWRAPDEPAVWVLNRTRVGR